MQFSDFVKKLHASDSVTIADMVAVLDAYHAGLGEIQIIPVPFDPPVGEAFFRRIETDRTSAYEEEFWNVAVYYCADLDNHPKQRRYVLAKELMHAFDPPESWASDKEKFIRLLKDIQNEPLPEDRTPVFSAEIETRWKALVALCPIGPRAEFTERFNAGEMEEYEIASHFGVPTWTVQYIVDDYFVQASERLLGS